MCCTVSLQVKATPPNVARQLCTFPFGPFHLSHSNNSIRACNQEPAVLQSTAHHCLAFQSPLWNFSSNLDNRPYERALVRVYLAGLSLRPSVENDMFSRAFVATTKSSASGAAGTAFRCRPFLGQVRFQSKQAFAGSKGREMSAPNQRARATAPVENLDATLTIRDGPVFHGTAFGANSNISGEAVFTTSLVGYPESMTDPSYRGQILVFTQPLIGNYGVPSSIRDKYNLLKYFESPHIQCAGIVVSDYAKQYSHWTAIESLSDWCAREGVPAISGVDTRAIVTHLREQGSSLARISIGDEYDADEDESFVDPGQINLVKRVSTKAPFVVSAPNPTFHIALIDCGVKENILRSLVSRGATVTVLPYNYPVHKIASEVDGVFISNGPGDPTHCMDTIYNLGRLMDESSVPVMGICLGHQLMALATGARTIKMKYGNRAHNIPALDLTTGQCHITSQNHGYAVDASTLHPDFKEYFVNLNDGSNEGMLHKTRPIFSTQFHPEAKGGPMDSSFLFDRYLQSVKLFKDSQKVYKDNRPSGLLVELLSKERVGVEPTPLNEVSVSS